MTEEAGARGCHHGALRRRCRAGFEHRQEAERFLEQLRERLRKFGLELHPDKTRWIEFGRFAAERREKRGEGKPETFNFLGFTHICGTSHQRGTFTIRRNTMGKRMAAKLKDVPAKLRSRMHRGVGGTVRWLQQVVRGYCNYHAGSGNLPRMAAFQREVLRPLVSNASATQPAHAHDVGEASMSGWLVCFHLFEFCTAIQPCALTPNIPKSQGRNRVR